MVDSILSGLNLPSTLQSRILCRVCPSPSPALANHATKSQAEPVTQNAKKFVLYLPTVVLRKRHNPAFALACRIANHFNVPVLVLVTVLDDSHLTRTPHEPIVSTARRLAFVLEALQSATKEWEAHGAGVAIRIHGPGFRTPHHLTLAHHAVSVVSDEPFVQPFRTYLRKVVLTCQSAKVPCYTVDGSTTVPPNSLLTKTTHYQASQVPAGDMAFQGSPAKAWIWEKKTEPYRKAQIAGAMTGGHLDAPPLQINLPSNFLEIKAGSDDVPEHVQHLLTKLPASWRKTDNNAPGNRPWSVTDLQSIDPKSWVMTEWPATDTLVPPCSQTDGSEASARRRWKKFRDGGGLKDYAKRRNLISSPHSVSRISCYLNLGILSIFDVVSDVWRIQAAKNKEGCRKFLEEVIKWREIGYVHTFAVPDYHKAQVLPAWSRNFLGRPQHKSRGPPFSYEDLARSNSTDETWNAMQSYLVQTGELHNNARMTWGKTVVHWQAGSSAHTPDDILWLLCTLNDRFALDGLSPPSYAGLLWCFGWCDKPDSSGNGIRPKWAHQYRQGPSHFQQATERLLHVSSTLSTSNASAPASNRSTEQEPAPKKARLSVSDSSTKRNDSSILSFFTPVSQQKTEGTNVNR